MNAPGAGTRLSRTPWTAVQIQDGHWEIRRNGHGPESVPIAVLDHHRDGHAPTRAQTGNDALLMAAAPEMLAFLRSLREAYQEGLVSDGEQHENQDEQTQYLVAELDAVIAKATL